MIVRPRLHWLRMIFVLRGSVLPTILPQLLWTTAFAVVVTLFHGQIYRWKVPLNFVPFSLIGLTLAIFLGFRNSTSYARWWEARTLWGAFLNDARSLLRQALTLVDAEGADLPTLAGRLMAFAHAARHQLRGSDPRHDLARLLPAADVVRLAAARHRAALLLLMIGEWLRDRRAAGQLAPVLVPAIERSLARLNDALGGCERIAATPIPFTYGVIIHRTTFLYCLMLPFGLVDAIGPTTPLVVAFIGYTFFSLEALTAEIEEPFGTAPNDLALDAMSRTIENALRDMLGEVLPRDPPPPEDFNHT